MGLLIYLEGYQKNNEGCLLIKYTKPLLIIPGKTNNLFIKFPELELTLIKVQGAKPKLSWQS